MLAKDLKRTFRKRVVPLSAVRGVCVNETAEYKMPFASMTEGRFGKRSVCGDAGCVSYDVHWFLKRLAFPARVAILFKGWQPREVAFMVVDISGVYWDDCDYPRVDLIDPPAIVEQFLGAGGFWGGFILAIAKVPSDMVVTGEIDPTFMIFTELVKTWAVV